MILFVFFVGALKSVTSRQSRSCTLRGLVQTETVRGARKARKLNDDGVDDDDGGNQQRQWEFFSSSRRMERDEEKLMLRQQ